VTLSPLGMSATIWPIVPATDDDDECAAVCGMSGRGSRIARGELVPVLLCLHKFHMS
jgi:hypothetical protein